ncbi:uncharacterized protein PAC_13405 [Phialocephala subalpina]|uniref:Uncharacterized protein n=1 Tax=Phialocephala subalpina TaxID=576137 RepID=A0A1L7XER7_9HELO|nr:uncharacterized protein PAC_13405 [Phialocephala subalpina]
MDAKYSDEPGTSSSSSAKFASPLLSLPPEIRNEIYEYTIDWPNFTDLFSRIHEYQKFLQGQESSEWAPLCRIARPHVASLTTPSILLLNAQISSETLNNLYRKPLILDSPPPHVPQLTKRMDITQFVSKATLQHLRFVSLKMDLSYKRNLMSGAAWLRTVEMLLEVWCEQSSLEWVEVQADYSPPPKSLGWSFGEVAHHRNVLMMLSMLKDFGKLVPVVWISEAWGGRMIRRAPDRH